MLHAESCVASRSVVAVINARWHNLCTLVPPGYNHPKLNREYGHEHTHGRVEHTQGSSSTAATGCNLALTLGRCTMVDPLYANMPVNEEVLTSPGVEPRKAEIHQDGSAEPAQK